MDLLFTPAKLGTCELKNRIVRSATNEHLSDEKGQVTPLWADTLIELAKNEVGLVITGHFCVDKMQRADAGQPVLTELNAYYRSLGVTEEELIQPDSAHLDYEVSDTAAVN